MIWVPEAQGAPALLADDDLRFDVVFTDVIMPGMSGIDHGQTVKHPYPGLPVVLTRGDSTVLAEEGRLGFELPQKPYAVEAMSRVLRKVIRRRDGVRS